MSYLLLLLIFWKPIYFSVMSIAKRDTEYLGQTLTWFKDAFTLVNPIGTSY